MANNQDHDCFCIITDTRYGNESDVEPLDVATITLPQTEQKVVTRWETPAKPDNAFETSSPLGKLTGARWRDDRRRRRRHRRYHG